MGLVKITRFDIYRFSLPLKRPLPAGQASLLERTGFIVELENDHGHFAFGETAPLAGLSHETLEQAGEQLSQLRHAVLGEEIPSNITDSEDGFGSWLGSHLAPSVRFGVESAILGLIAQRRRVGLLHFLTDTPRETVTVNGLLAGTPEQILDKAAWLVKKGFRAFKLKVGRQTVSEDIALVHTVRDVITDEALLRLDANRTWTSEQAMSFAEAVPGLGIDYIEEPVKTWEELKTLLLNPQFTLPVAVDESLADVFPKDMASLLQTAIKAVIIKPMLFGLEGAIRLAKEAARLDMVPVISATFESSVGIGVLATMAASLSQQDIPAGLDTLDWLADDLLYGPVTVENGSVEIGKHRNPANRIKRDLLTPFTHG